MLTGHGGQVEAKTGDLPEVNEETESEQEARDAE